MQLILASTSPRRSEILALLGLPFEIVAPDFDERMVPERPIEREVSEFALGKALSVAQSRPGDIIIGSDTMILIDGAKIGKPADEAEGRRMLGALAGRRHEIFTAVAIVEQGGASVRAIMETVRVQMRPYGERDIEAYLACGESLDKAGAYSIQGRGRELIASIEGDYLAAVGLPLKGIASHLVGRGMKPALDVEDLYRNKDYLNWRSFAETAS